MSADDRGAIEVVERHRNYLKLIARVQIHPGLRGRLDPSDAVQQTLLKAYQKRDQFKGSTEAQQLAWLRQILANHLADQARRYDAEGRALGPELEASAARLEQWLTAGDPSPASQAMRQERLARLADALAALPEDQRAVVELHHLRGAPIAEIAAALGRSQAAVGSLLFRGMKALRSGLGDDA